MNLILVFVIYVAKLDTFQRNAQNKIKHQTPVLMHKKFKTPQMAGI